MSVWTVVCRLLEKHLASGERLDELLEAVPNQMAAEERRRCRHLLYGVVRHLGLLDAALAGLMARKPRPRLRALLLVGSFELLEHPENAPQIVHHWVGEARRLTSAGEARLVNAVLRRVGPALAEIAADASTTPAALARRFSHPAWLVERWIERFGTEATLKFLAWNQRPAPVHARMSQSAPASAGKHTLSLSANEHTPSLRATPLERGSKPSSSGTSDRIPAGEGWRAAPGCVYLPLPDPCAYPQPPGASLPPFFQPTSWPGFYRLERPEWGSIEELLAAGRIYLQDPATAIAPQLLAAAPGEAVLDVCAAPGGKTLQLAEAAAPNGRVVAVDLKGARLERLRRNLASRPNLAVTVFAADATTLEAAALEAVGLPARFDAVLVDVPCSNTGVLRHRVDVKGRLRPADLDGLARLQGAILRRAAALVRRGGRLVYSTCSLEREENDDVVAAFLAESAGKFALERSAFSRPWESGCDGAGAFLLRRVG